MRRWLLILLLCLLPYQMVWAAAAPYCAHEPEVKVQHLGHHEHKHQAADAQAEGDDGPAGSFHADCESCHLANPGWVVEDLLTFNQSTMSVQMYAAPRYSSCVPPGPERPQRLLACSAVRFGSVGVLDSSPI
ncbi:cobalt-zinc-cadmium resistance protein [Caenimonas sedimenti]|uniref:Cobalt-zinc-cadmium resistance protein n=1 Tax=Caenimonas sedimenti TaxID=2596921 RepID=A0A562ZIH3_9BURK|nr:cobalt-zinc-cadmium resistance protein [Caenimonas sedimenti]TWO67994.1 cobalt-zinc-cadmium resistance protein [Caenimonas sedimenti]